MLRYDRTIKYTTDRIPTLTEVESMLQRFVGDVGASIRWEKDRHIVVLPGASAELSRVLEVLLQGNSSSILTAGANDFTTALANHLHQMLRRDWPGDGTVWVDDRVSDPEIVLLSERKMA